jgi:hypothetical protein
VFHGSKLGEGGEQIIQLNGSLCLKPMMK